MHSGGFAVEGNTTNGATYAKKTVTATRDAYARVWFNLKSEASQVNLLRMRCHGQRLARLRLRDGDRAARDGATT